MAEHATVYILLAKYRTIKVQNPSQWDMFTRVELEYIQYLYNRLGICWKVSAPQCVWTYVFAHWLMDNGIVWQCNDIRSLDWNWNEWMFSEFCHINCVANADSWTKSEWKHYRSSHSHTFKNVVNGMYMCVGLHILLSKYCLDLEVEGESFEWRNLSQVESLVSNLTQLLQWSSHVRCQGSVQWIESTVCSYPGCTFYSWVNGGKLPTFPIFYKGTNCIENLNCE